MIITRPRVLTYSCSEFCLSFVIDSVLVNGPTRLLIVNRLNSTCPLEVCLWQVMLSTLSDEANDLSYPIGYGLDQVNVYPFKYGDYLTISLRLNSSSSR